MRKRYLNVYVVCIALVFASVAPVDAFIGKKGEINTNWAGLAIKGYDSVAYFTEGQPRKGLKQFEFEWKGVKWRFAAAAHREMFIDDPTKYAPQYGGY